tara:strand:+ start:121 stop:624 length:504 start_codon:yes stop_codon:yes gene_type:complete
MGNLTLNITENIDVSTGGFQYNYTTTGANFDLVIANVDSFNAQTVNIGDSAFTQVAKFSSGATQAMGTYDSAKFKYMRFRNTHGSSTLTLQLSDSTTNKQVNYKIAAGEAMYFTSLAFDCNASTSAASDDVVQGTQNVTTLAATADEVQIKSSSGTVSVDTLIAYDL